MEKESISRKQHDVRAARVRARLRVWRDIMAGKRRMRPNAAVGKGKAKVVPVKKGGKK